MPEAGKYALVALPVPLRSAFTYRVPPELDPHVKQGAAVEVTFGRRRMTGVVLSRSGRPPSLPESAVLDLRDVRSPGPVIEKGLLDLLSWAAGYYIEPAGEMMRAAIPPGLFSDGSIYLSASQAGAKAGPKDEECGKVLSFVRSRGWTRLSQAAAKSGAKHPRLCAALLQAAGLLAIGREKPGGGDRMLVLSPDADEGRVAAFQAGLKRPDGLIELLACRGSMPVGEVEERFPGAAAKVRRLCDSELAFVAVAGGGAGGIEGRAQDRRGHVQTEAQAAAISEINRSIGGGFRSFLLHGVTGSGKTEVYLHAAGRALEQGRGVIYLVPEISLTIQAAVTLRAAFPDEVAVLHSGLRDRDRIAGWEAAASGARRIVLGTRSAVFAPVRDLGLVIVDEEHDAAYKQEESPRYNARDLAIKRSQTAGAVALLGSATPSLESYGNALKGRSVLLELPERVTGHPLPEVSVAELGGRRRGEGRPRRGEAPVVEEPESAFFMTPEMMEGLGGALESGRQAILLLNRRGYSSFVACADCGRQFMCPQCSVSMTYHRTRRSLVCHYCGKVEREPASCPGCGGAISMMGVGTERVEAELKRLFPRARISRLDRDVVSDPGEAERIIETFGAGGADILVGTQMVAKGHHFPWVTFVGIVLADIGLAMPDFRAGERLFSLLTQVAGRSGRGAERGKVLIQTFNPDHYSIIAARRHDYRQFHGLESEARRELGYPPFSRLVRLVFESGSAERSLAAAARAAGVLSRCGGGDLSVLGPAPAILGRLKGAHRSQVLIKGGASLAKAKAAIGGMLDFKSGSHPFPGVRVVVDVDPVAML